MLVRIPLLLAHFALLGCGINNNCGKYNPFGCAKGDETGSEETASMVSETTSTTPASTSTGSTTTTGGSSTGTTTPVEPTTSSSTTSSTTVETATLDTTTTTDSSMTSDTTASTAETTSTTGDLCGNGVIDGMEECDDGNKDAADGCDQCSADRRTVFVTGGTYKGDLGGLAMADAKCQDLADAAGLGGQFKAWLSTPMDPVSARIGAGFNGIYQLPKGKQIDEPLIAVGWGELISGSLKHPINRDQAGITVGQLFVWTGTGAKGDSLTKNCALWGSSMFSDEGQVGDSGAQDSTWTNNSTAKCGISAGLYCFEVKAP